MWICRSSAHRTVELAAAAGLAGIAMQAGIRRSYTQPCARVAETRRSAEHLFVFGIDAADVRA